jgi:hypothetical protein
MSKPAPTYTAGMVIQSKISGTFFTQGPWEEGALGCFARDKDGKPVLLTNSHVLFPLFLVTSHLGVYQPDYSSCCSGGEKIGNASFEASAVKDGKYKGGFKTQLGDGVIPSPSDKGWKMERNLQCSETDCGIARLAPGVKFRNVLPVPGAEIQITGINDDVLSVLGPKAGTAPKPEQYVRVFTPRNGGRLIHGTLAWREVDFTEPSRDSILIGGKRVSPIYEKAFMFGSPADMEAKGAFPLIKQFVILPRPAPIAGEADYRKFYGKPNEMLSFDHGDSGSVVIDHEGKVIAQVVGGFQFIPDLYIKKDEDVGALEFQEILKAKGNVAIATPIRAIVEQLNITIPANFAGTVPSAATDARVFVSLPEPAHRTAERAGLERLRAALKTSRGGKLLLGKIAQHRTEVKRLFATVRAVSSAWHEAHGPALYYHCALSLRERDHHIPTSINGVCREELLQNVLPLLERHGSPALRRDIQRYRVWAARSLLHVDSLHEVPQVLAQRRRSA